MNIQSIFLYTLFICCNLDLLDKRQTRIHLIGICFDEATHFAGYFWDERYVVYP